MAIESFAAARELLRKGHYRSAISRSYFSAYCAITAQLIQRKITFANGNNPPHARIKEMVKNDLGLEMKSTAMVARGIDQLYKARIEADYQSGYHPDRSTARAVVRLCGEILTRVENC